LLQKSHSQENAYKLTAIHIPRISGRVILQLIYFDLLDVLPLFGFVFELFVLERFHAFNGRQFELLIWTLFYLSNGIFQLETSQAQFLVVQAVFITEF